MRVVHEFSDGDYPVKLEVSSKGKFRVTYGAQVCGNLDYAAAAYEYGTCVFHSLCCAGKMDEASLELA